MALHPRHVHPNPAAASEPHHAAYPSSESDAQVDAQVDAPASTVESRPLLATSQHAAPQANRVVHRSTSSAPSSGRKRRTPLKCTQAIWVTFTVLLIAILGYSSQLCIMLPYYNNTPSFSLQRLAAVLVPFNLGLIAIFYNYWLCVTTDPGSVPAGWEPEWSALDPLPPPATAQPHAQTAHDFTSSYLHPAAQTGPTLELKQAIYRPRYCKSCAAYKPPRSHHCKTCQRCVLRMDHHCPWLANCVGHFNYVHFIRFLFYVDITCVYHLVIISCRVLDTFNSYSYWREPSASELVWLVVNYALCTPVILLVGIFSMYHFYCTSINQTTIESWEKDRTATMIRRGRIRNIKYPYNLGFWRNCASILGHNPVMWCIPNTSSNTAGDGLKFPVADGLDEGAQYRWPPKDPSRSTSSAHNLGWRQDPTQAPPLFPSAPTTPSPFTYGTGFNPHLQPTNSTTLRNRIPPTPTPTPIEKYSNVDQESDESSVSSNSDDEYPHIHPPEFVAPSPSHFIPINGSHQYDHHALEELPFEDEELEEITDQRVTVRRGSEGYEVRPRSSWIV